MRWFLDILSAIGLVSIGFGIWKVYPPAAWIFGGVSLFIVAELYGAYRERRRGK